MGTRPATTPGMMLVDGHGVLIDRPVAAAFEFVAVRFFDHMPLWNPAVLELSRLDDGPVRVGTRGHMIQVIHGRQFGRTFEVTTMEPPRVFAITGLHPEGADEHYRCRYLFLDMGPLSHVEVRLELGWNPTGSRFARPLLKRIIQMDLEANLARMKQAVEARHAA